MNKKMNKKGMQLNMAAGAVITLILVALLVIVSIVIFTSLGGSLATANTAGSAVNETTSAVVTETGVYLSATSLLSPVCTIGIVTNATDGALILGNYTANNCRIYYSGTTAAGKGINNSLWNVSYSYTYSARTAATNASQTMTTNFTTYPALVGLVGTIIFLALVIGVLVASFAFGKKPGV